MISFIVGASTNVQINPCFAYPIFIKQFSAYIAPLTVCPNQLNLDSFQAVIHSINVQVESDQFATMHRNDFVNAVTEQESAIHRRYLRLI